MGGNSFGKIFKVTTFGESHGPGIGALIDGCPPCIGLKPEDFRWHMERRRPGRHDSDTPRREGDEVEIHSGVFEGLTTGTPILLYIRNRDADSRPYEILREVFRPGHGDYTYFQKYGHFDFRGGGRYSARETASRVAAGVVAEKILEPLGIEVTAYTLGVGGGMARKVDLDFVEKNPLFSPDPACIQQMELALDEARAQGDSLGGLAGIVVRGCPAGLGEPVFDKLDADLAKALMSVGTVKGVEIGAGFEAARLKGSENNDPLTPKGFGSNRAGGILGGISNGDDITLRVSMKPIPSIRQEQDTIDREKRSTKLRLTGRFDTSAVPRVIPVLEAMVRLVLVDHFLRARSLGLPAGGTTVKGRHP